MNIVITGASSGIGYATAQRFAAESGNLIFAMARSGDKLEELSASAGKSRIIPVVQDLTDFEYAGLEAALQQEGITHIDILIHNAGYLVNKPFEELVAADWHTIYNTNVISIAMLTRHLVPRMGGNEENHTHIVMIGSIGGVNGSSKFPGLSAYSSSKGAVSVLAECLAEEFRGRGISVNCLALGAVETEMLSKAFPGYVPKTKTSEAAGYIYDFSVGGWRHFNGKILEVSTTNP